MNSRYGGGASQVQASSETRCDLRGLALPDSSTVEELSFRGVDPAFQIHALHCSPRQRTSRISGLVWHPSLALTTQSHGNVGLRCETFERGRYRTSFGI